MKKDQQLQGNTVIATLIIAIRKIVQLTHHLVMVITIGIEEYHFSILRGKISSIYQCRRKGLQIRRHLWAKKATGDDRNGENDH